jgi:dipeptidyl aminopeptidase/acylaminoacyl peptidase
VARWHPEGMSCRDRVIATVLALLALALGAAALFSEMAAAAWPGRNVPVVYLGVRPETSNTACCSGYKTTGLRIFEPGVPGSARVLTTDPSDADPQVSPDGRTIVFTREIPSGLPFPLETEHVIFAIGIDGSGLRQVTAVGTEAGSDFKPSFYPSGETLVFARGGGRTGENDLYSVRLDGSGLRQITQGPAREEAPAVSPNGRQIAFTCGPAGGNERIEGVCSIRPDGSQRRLLTRKLKQGAEVFDPDFSPSGRTIAFTLGPGTASDIFTMRADGSRLGALTNRAPNGRRKFPRYIGYASPAFAPGGSSMIALKRPGAGPRLVRIRLRDPSHPVPLLPGSLGSAPVWAPG